MCVEVIVPKFTRVYYPYRELNNFQSSQVGKCSFDYRSGRRDINKLTSPNVEGENNPVSDEQRRLCRRNDAYGQP